MQRLSPACQQCLTLPSRSIFPNLIIFDRIASGFSE